MEKKKKHDRLKKIVMGEAVALLLIVNVVLILWLDNTCGMRDSVTDVTNNAKKVDSSLQNAGTGEENTELTATEQEALGRNELQQEAKKIARSVDDKHSILVNKDHKVPDDYKVSLVTYKKTGKQVAKVMNEPLKEMLSDGEQQGLSFVICSAYRSNASQKKLFKKRKKRYVEQGMSEQAAETEAAKSVQPSGYSEHATGLAVDIVSKTNAKLDSSQEETEEFQWLKENCAKYGFILRYPEGKTDVTGIIYEPWHFRYVGKEAAQFIEKNALTYEEFYEMAHTE